MTIFSTFACSLQRGKKCGFDFFQLGGIAIRNDGKCHLNEANTYSMTNELVRIDRHPVFEIYSLCFRMVQTYPIIDIVLIIMIIVIIITYFTDFNLDENHQNYVRKKFVSIARYLQEE